MNKDSELICMAQCKLTMQQSNLLDEMARSNNTTRSYELRLILELYGRERLNILDEDRRELVDAEKAGMTLYELYKEVYPDKAIIPYLHSIPWYTGIQVSTVAFVGLLSLEMLNKTSRDLLFRYTCRHKPQIEKRYPELGIVLDKIIDLTKDDIIRLDSYMVKNDSRL